MTDKITLRLSDKARARVKSYIEALEMMEDGDEDDDDTTCKAADLQVLLDIHDKIHGIEG